MTRLKESGQIESKENFDHFKTIGKSGNVKPTCANFNPHSYGDGTHEDKRDDLQGEGIKVAIGNRQVWPLLKLLQGTEYDGPWEPFPFSLLNRTTTRGPW